MIRSMWSCLRFLACLAVLTAAPGYSGRAAEAGATSRIVMMIGEDEYKTWETLPAFADEELKPLGHDIRIIHQDPEDKHNFPGLVDALGNADLLIVSVRRRSPPTEQLEALRRHLKGGRALIGIRTASHAFTLRGEDKEEMTKHPERSEWVEFDGEVLGGNYQGHHGTGPLTTIVPRPGVAENPIVQGMGVWFSRASLYKTAPVAADAEVLLLGLVSGHPAEALAWTRLYGPGRARVFYTSLGSETDFAEPHFRRLLVNAVQWALDGPKSPESFRLDDVKGSD